MKRTILAVVGLAVCFFAIRFAPFIPAYAQDAEWQKVDEALGRKPAVSDDVRRYGFPRSDLSVTLDGVAIKPALALGGWVAFKPAHGGAMAHLRTNLTVRVKRSALGLGAATTLEQGGAIVRGEITNPDGSKRRYHFQVLASAEKGQNPEATMWTMVPDIDLLRNLLSNEDPDWVAIVFRGLGEMDGDKRSGPGSTTSFVNLTNGADPLQNDGLSARAWVNFTPTPNDYAA